MSDGDAVGSAHTYALLVPSGMESVALASLGGLLAADVYVEQPPLPALVGGTAVGPAGSMRPVLVRSADPLPLRVLCAPCVCTALALVSHGQSYDGGCSAEALSEAAISNWEGALATWAAHRGVTLEADTSVGFRAATLRSGTHAFTSKELEAALGGAVLARQQAWRVNLSSPDLLLLGLVVQAELTLGLLLPPYEARKGDTLPLEVRPWLLASRDRPHTRPSRAACLARLLAPKEGEVAMVEPCGGIGVLAIEAASAFALHVVTVDCDAAASAAAKANAASAARAGALRGAVSAVLGDGYALPMAAGSFDLAIADIPFGLRHKRLDVGRLLRELGRLLRVDGRALILGSAGPGGTAAACAKVVRKQLTSVWRLAGRTECASGGVACEALLFVRLSGGGVT